MPAPILVPTDLSDAAAEAFALALRLARGTGAHVHLFHVIRWPDAGPFEVPGEAPTASQETDEERALAHAALASLVAQAGATDEVTIMARHGSRPAAEAGEVARSVGAGLIVAGRCRRRPHWQGLGTVASELIHTAPCDVLLVPDRAEPDAAPTEGPVLVAVDFSQASAEVVRTGLAAAAALGDIGVDLVHVLEPMPHPVRWLDETLLDLLPGIRERADAALRELVAEVGPEAGEVRLFVERGKAARTVARTAQALGSSIVVVGPHAERLVLDGVLGSVAEGIARRATAPVWIVRPSAVPPESV